MGRLLDDRVWETTLSTGTGPVVLAGRQLGGYQAFGDLYADGSVRVVCIADRNNPPNFEICQATYNKTPNTLTRGAVIKSTNGNALVNFGNGVKDVFVDCPADYLPPNANGPTLPANPYLGMLFLHTPTGRNYLMAYGPSGWTTRQSTGQTDVYVDPVNGTDAPGNGWGTGVNAYQTIQYAVLQTPFAPDPSNPINIHLTNATHREQPVVTQRLAPSGIFLLGVEGADVLASTAVSSASNPAGNGSAGYGTLTVTGANWTPGQFVGRYLEITQGTDSGEMLVIHANTANTITVTGQWATVPDATSRFHVFDMGSRITGSNSGADTTPVRAYGVVVESQQSNVTLQNIRIDYCTTAGVYVNGWSYCALQKCQVVNNQQANVLVTLYSSLSVIDCAFSGVNGSGTLADIALQDFSDCFVIEYSRLASAGANVQNLWLTDGSKLSTEKQSYFGKGGASPGPDRCVYLQKNCSANFADYTEFDGGTVNNFQAIDNSAVDFLTQTTTPATIRSLNSSGWGLFTDSGSQVEGAPSITYASNTKGNFSLGPANVLSAYNVKVFGAKGDGSTDDSTAIQNAINACQNGGGGTVYFPPATYLVNSQLTFPAGSGGGNHVTLRGAGGDTSYDTTIRGASTLDLRYAGTVGKILTQFNGTLEITGLNIAENGGSNSGLPLVYTTNTVLHIHDCGFYGNPSVTGASCTIDAIILGGTATTSTGSTNDPFQGYGTVIRDNVFHRVRRAVYGRTFCNGTQVINNTVAGDCGAGSGAAAFEYLGATPAANNSIGCWLAGNLVEMTNYTYGVKLTSCQYFSVVNNNFYDPLGTTTEIFIDSTCLYCTVVIGYTSATNSVTDNSGNSLILTARPSKQCVFPTQVSFLQPPTCSQTGAVHGERFGNGSLPNTSTGDYNTAFGNSALASNTTGAGNVAIGPSALTVNTTGGSNIAVGYNALSSNTTASNNVAVGYQALQNTTTGHDNFAFGYQALLANTTGNQNAAIGSSSLRFNTTGANNVGVGFNSLNTNTTGGQNTALGTQAFASNSTNSYTTAIGYQALISATVDQTVAVGALAFGQVTTGGSGVAVGYRAGYTATTGANNTCVGWEADVAAAGTSNAIALGYGAVASANEFAVGPFVTYHSFYGQDSTSTTVALVRLRFGFDVNTHGSYQSFGKLQGTDATTDRDCFWWGSNGSVAVLSFFGVTKVVQQANASQAAINAITDANAKAVCQAFYNLLKNYGLAPATA